MAHSAAPLRATFEGHISSTLDALLLFEACLSGTFNHVPRRPHDRERSDLIKSGNVFVYEEHSSGIKRWTDGVNWSPSRILGNFLIYRELEKPFAPGEKKRAAKRPKKPNGVSKPGDGRPSPSSSITNNLGSPSVSEDTRDRATRDAERALIGSLVDSYPFKPEGLVKKTISITYNGVPHHLVSYYKVKDVLEGRMAVPHKHHYLKNVMPRPELISSQNFRAPIDEIEYNPDDPSEASFLFARHMANLHAHPDMVQRTMSMPSVPSIGHQPYPPMGNDFPMPPDQFMGHSVSHPPPVAVGYQGQQPGAQFHMHAAAQNRVRFHSLATLGHGMQHTFGLGPRRHSTVFDPSATPDLFAPPTQVVSIMQPSRSLSNAMGGAASGGMTSSMGGPTIGSSGMGSGNMGSGSMSSVDPSSSIMSNSMSSLELGPFPGSPPYFPNRPPGVHPHEAGFSSPNGVQAEPLHTSHVQGHGHADAGNHDQLGSDNDALQRGHTEPHFMGLGDGPTDWSAVDLGNMAEANDHLGDIGGQSQNHDLDGSQSHWPSFGEDHS